MGLNHKPSCGFDGKGNMTQPYTPYLSNAGQDTSSLISEPSLLPVVEKTKTKYDDLRWDKLICIKKNTIQYTVCVLPSEMPLDRVELSAWQRLGLWLSITLSSSKWRDPALGKVALLNSTVFILWIKLGESRQRYLSDLIIPVIQSHPFSCQRK